MTPALAARVAAVKPALLAHLAAAVVHAPLPDVGPWAASGAEAGEGATGAALPSEAAAWGEDAREVFMERMAMAPELEMDVEPGSPAWEVALREARREQAGVPIAHRTALIDAALAAFAPGGLTFRGMLSREQHTALTAAPDIVPRDKEHKPEWKHHDVAAPVQPGDAREGGR